jgi:hypothetical protein
MVVDEPRQSDKLGSRLRGFSGHLAYGAYFNGTSVEVRGV